MYYNARSLLPKLDFLRVLCSTHTPDCVCIVESWLSNDIQNSELYINGYSIVRLDRNRHGGGVLLFINSVFTHSIIFSGSAELELVIISITQTNNVALTLALFYRPPSSSYCVLDNLLTILCTYIDPPCLTNFILLGDFNMILFILCFPSYVWSQIASPFPKLLLFPRIFHLTVTHLLT